MQNPEISLIIPAYNESSTIERVLRELEAYMRGYRGDDDWEIVVVNDGSSDSTMSVLQTFSQGRPWLKIIDLIIHQGRGKALRRGFEHAQGGIIVSLDADLSYAPYHIQRLVEKITGEHADIVLASAYGNGGTVKNVPWKRLWLSRIGNTVLSYMFGGGLSVLTCVVRAYRKEFLDRLDLHSDDKEIHLEILYKTRLLGGKIVEIPADLCWREEKLSKINTTGQTGRRSTLKIKKTSSSHLFFALLSKPGFIFWVPGYILLVFSALTSLVLLYVIGGNITHGDSLYEAVRNTMITGPLTWLSAAFSFMLGVQFLTLGFLTNQTKRNHEEMYKTVNAIFTELKKTNKQ